MDRSIDLAVQHMYEGSQSSLLVWAFRWSDWYKENTHLAAQPSPYLGDPLPAAPTVLTLKFTKGAGCRTLRSRMQNQEPHAEHHFANFFVVVLVLR